MPVALPLDIENPVRMLRAVPLRTEIMKNARAAHLVALMASWLGAAPPPLAGAVLGHDSAGHAAPAAAEPDLHQCSRDRRRRCMRREAR